MKNITKRSFSGIRQKHVNEVVWNIYGYKFYRNENCLRKLIAFAHDDISTYRLGQDIIVIPINPRNSNSNLVRLVARQIASIFEFKFKPLLSKTNRGLTSHPDLRGKTVLIFDDVIYTGRTAERAKKALLSLKHPPAKILFYALAKSKSCKL